MFHFAVGLCLSLGFFGCGGGSKLDQPVASPPDIPLLAPGQRIATADPGITGQAMPFEDIRALAENDPYYIRLKLAVQSALTLNAIEPEGDPPLFAPDNPITYEEFLRWLEKFRQLDPNVKVSSAPTEKPTSEDPIRKAPPKKRRVPGAEVDEFEHLDEPKPADTEEPAEDLEPQAEDTTSTETSSRLDPALAKQLSEALAKAKVPMTDDGFITRQTLLYLAHTLRPQSPPPQTAAKKLPEAIAQPPLEKALEDYDTVAIWAKPAVRQAYDSRLLGQVFHLVTDAGQPLLLIPEQPATRAEAVLLLYHLYALR